MAIKKSDLYSSIWASCDELRGGMDASQYKDYVLFMLFIKYVSDKYGNYDGFEPPIIIPKGASFEDMVALKGDPDIGNKINTRAIQPLIDANARLARSDFPDFNDPNKLGDGQARVERLGNLIAIFENPALDFSQNRAEHDADPLFGRPAGEGAVARVDDSADPSPAVHNRVGRFPHGQLAAKAGAPFFRHRDASISHNVT